MVHRFDEEDLEERNLREDKAMKKSEIKLIICGIASLVISVILAIVTIFVFIANIGMATDVEKIEGGFEDIRNTIESMAESFDDGIDVDVEVPEIVVET